MGQSRFSRTASFPCCIAAWFSFLPAITLCQNTPPSPPSPPSLESFCRDLDRSQAATLPQGSAPSYQGEWQTRDQLSGDWFGSRDDLAAHGFRVFADFTQFEQGVASGGRQQEFVYGGRGDYLIDLDSGKLGLWDGGALDLRAESRYGQDTNRIDGSLAPSNFAMALPKPNQNITALTGVQFTQKLSDHLAVFAGKLNILDGTPASYVQGRRLRYFWNAAMQFNLSRAYLLPSTLGTGFTLNDDVEPVFNFLLLDTHYTPTTTGFPSLFSNGVVMYGEYRLRTSWWDRPGHSALGFLYSNATRRSLGSNPYISLPIYPGIMSLPTRSSAWTAIYRFDQVLTSVSHNSERGWTLYGDLGLTDGDPNPIRWFGNLSLVGTGQFPGRAIDSIGIGYYHIAVSNLQILRTLGLQAENGVELYYNIALTPWCHITPDLQILDPAQIRTPTAILIGVRLGLTF